VDFISFSFYTRIIKVNECEYQVLTLPPLADYIKGDNPQKKKTAELLKKSIQDGIEQA
jgi:hypothetical protein